MTGGHIRWPLAHAAFLGALPSGVRGEPFGVRDQYGSWLAIAADDRGLTNEMSGIDAVPKVVTEFSGSHAFRVHIPHGTHGTL